MRDIPFSGKKPELKLHLVGRTRPLPPSNLPTPPLTPPSTPRSTSPSSPSTSPSSKASWWRPRSPSTPPPTPSSSEDSWRRRSPSASSTTSWRSGSPTFLKQTSTPAFDELKVGEVLFLPHQEIPSSSVFKNGQGDPFEHMVVVVRKWKQDQEECVEFRIITSFHGTKLEDKWKPEFWHQYAMVDNAQDVSSQKGAKLLTGSGKLQKRSYVNLRDNSIWSIEYKYLDVCHRPLVFDAESTKTIVRALDSWR